MTDAQIFALEKQAMTGDKMAVVRLVSTFRLLRAAAKTLLEDRWMTAVDSVMLSRFEQAVQDCWSDWGDEEAHL